MATTQRKVCRSVAVFLLLCLAFKGGVANADNLNDVQHEIDYDWDHESPGFSFEEIPQYTVQEAVETEDDTPVIRHRYSDEGYKSGRRVPGKLGQTKASASKNQNKQKPQHVASQKSKSGPKTKVQHGQSSKSKHSRISVGSEEPESGSCHCPCLNKRKHISERVGHSKSASRFDEDSLDSSSAEKYGNGNPDGRRYKRQQRRGRMFRRRG